MDHIIWFTLAELAQAAEPRQAPRLPIWKEHRANGYKCQIIYHPVVEISAIYLGPEIPLGRADLGRKFSRAGPIPEKQVENLKLKKQVVKFVENPQICGKHRTLVTKPES